MDNRFCLVETIKKQIARYGIVNIQNGMIDVLRTSGDISTFDTLPTVLTLCREKKVPKSLPEHDVALLQQWLDNTTFSQNVHVLSNNHKRVKHSIANNNAKTKLYEYDRHIKILQSKIDNTKKAKQDYIDGLKSILNMLMESDKNGQK